VRIIPWLCIVLGAACGKPAGTSSPATAKGKPSYPLLDGRCDEYPAIAQERHRIAAGIELFLFQDPDYLWLCFTLPPDAFGATDVVVAAPGLSEPLNLHVSAQLGEWVAARPEAAPGDVSSDRWWNQRGWTAMPVPFNGVTDDAGSSFKFKPTPGRELQLGKRRFGRGPWRLAIHIAGLGDGSDAPQTARFPARGEHGLTAW
jgi:hypothetical protein